MKILIITQTVDRAHPVLGFFHDWIAEFAKQFDSIQVIALSVGKYALPQNVAVHSLGKESGGDRLTYTARFYALLSELNGSYDTVFVHMNPEYIVLAGFLWKMTGKKIALWYNHTVGSVWLKVAQLFTDIVFHTSPFAYTARYKNAQRMPAGIDTNTFKLLPWVARIPKSIYFQGRVAPAKRVHIILEAFKTLHAEGAAELLTIVGPEETGYTQGLKSKYADLVQKGAIVFKGPVKHSDTLALFAAHTVSVNLTDRGNYDKTVLESLACGTPVITSSQAFKDAPVTLIQKPDAALLADAFRTLPGTPSETLTAYVESHESLKMLAEGLARSFGSI